MDDVDYSTHVLDSSQAEPCHESCGRTGPNMSSSVSTFTDSITFWMNGVLSLILVIVGMIGNAAVVVSFHCLGGPRMRHRRRQAFYYYLMTFAIWNSGLLVATVLFNCIPALITSDGPVSADLMHLSDLSSLIGYLGGNCCVTANVWLAVTLTVERYMAVSRPLQSRLSSPRRRAKVVCAMLSLLVLVYNSPLLFEMTFAPDPDHSEYSDSGYSVDSNSTNTTAPTEEIRAHAGYKLQLSEMRFNFYYQFVYRVVANFIFVSFVPFSIILLLTVKIVCVVRESNRKRARFRKPTPASDTRSLSNTASTTPPTAPPTSARYADVMLTLIAIKFLFFYTLPVVVNIVELTTSKETFLSEESSASKFLRFLVDLANLLVVVDGATNSFFYFSWRNRLRERLRARRYSVEVSKYNNYTCMNVESRCTYNEGGLGGMVSEMGTGNARKKSRIEWSPSTNELAPFRGLTMDRSWIPLKNVGTSD